MAISFHCDFCDRKIEAPDSAGGKWGKCPSCHNKIYIPNLAAEDDELTFAPVDEEAEKKEKELMAETFKLQQAILKEKGDAPAKSFSSSPSKIGEKDLNKTIIIYLRQMANGDLDGAGKILGSIIPYSKQAVKVIDRIAVSDMPEPELADIPPQVLAGFIRTLRASIT